MKERPILFSDEMVRAILAGQKTQTRRVIKNTQEYTFKGMDGHIARFGYADSILYVARHCPYGIPGDRLWVRETWAAPGYLDHRKPSDIEDWNPILYRADGFIARQFAVDKNWLSSMFGRWRPSIFMPRWASRINLEIVNVRVERLQDISEEDAKAEGVSAVMRDSGGCLPWGEWVEIPSYYDGFVETWDRINAKRSCGWDTNPWVWVIEFQVKENKEGSRVGRGKR